MLEAVARAWTAGAMVSYADNHRVKRWSADEARPSYERVLAEADIVIASDEEARMLRPGADPATLAQRLSEAGPAEAVVTLGADGAVAWIDGTHHEVPAEPVTAVDTVGA